MWQVVLLMVIRILRCLELTHAWHAPVMTGCEGTHSQGAGDKCGQNGRMNERTTCETAVLSMK